MVCTRYYKKDVVNGLNITKLYFLFKLWDRPFMCFKNAHKSNDHINILSKILMTFSRIQRDALLRGETLELPYGLGKLQLVRKHNPIRFVKGKRLNPMTTIDWVATKKLWKEDPEAKAKRTIMKEVMPNYNDDYIKVQYSAAYKFNKAINFKTTYSMRKALREKFVNHEIDAPIMDMTQYD